MKNIHCRSTGARYLTTGFDSKKIVNRILVVIVFTMAALNKISRLCRGTLAVSFPIFVCTWLILICSIDERNDTAFLPPQHVPRTTANWTAGECFPLNSPASTFFLLLGLLDFLVFAFFAKLFHFIDSQPHIRNFR